MGHRYTLLMLLCLLANHLFAQRLKSEQNETFHTAELRMGASFTKSFRHGFSFSLEEEVRTSLGGSYSAYPILNDGTLVSIDSLMSVTFTRANTTLTLAYEPIDYIAIAIGYRMKVYGNHGWIDPNEYIRHRAFINLKGQWEIGQWKLSLRERLLFDCRTDSINPNEKNRIDLSLRSRAQVVYSMFSKPIKYHLNVELINTLNQPTDYLNTYAITSSHTSYGQYISSVRPEIGMSWRIDKRNTLSFYYRYDYSYDRDINITRNKHHVELTHTYHHTHIIGIAYDFDW